MSIFKESLRRFRESVNLKLYDKKERVLSILRVLRLLTSLFSLSVIIYFYGFSLSPEQQKVQIQLIRGSFVFFVVSYIIRLLFEFDIPKFIRTNLLESVLILLIVIDGIFLVVFKRPIIANFFTTLGFDKIDDFFIVFIQIFLLLIVGIEFGKITRLLGSLDFSPQKFFISSFVLLILSGCGLLMLPECSVEEGSMNFVDALFTSISASCVTGLIVVDTATYFTFKGKLVILLLMQLGGLNIITFGSFFAFLSQKGVGLKQQVMVKDFMSFESLSTTKSLLREILYLAFFIEVAGAIFMFKAWGATDFDSTGKKVFYSVFHSVSAFNNAGFSLFTDGYFNQAVRTNFGLHILTGVMIFVGSIGFPAFIDMFGRKSLRERILYPWKTLKVGTRLAFYSSFVLIILGASVFYLMESKNSDHFLEGGFIRQNTIEKIVTSVFQSINRTSGFSSVDMSVLSTTTLFVFIFLMFVGASPGSTGGGIKTTTFSVLLLSAFSTIRGKKNIELWSKTIPNEIVRKALAILFFTLFFVFTSTIILTITDPDIDFIRLFFEEVSAFSTVGLSTGITSQLSTAGKVVIMSSMFIGRIGVLTLAFALGRKAISNNYKYPDTYVMVG